MRAYRGIWSLSVLAAMAATAAAQTYPGQRPSAQPQPRRVAPPPSAPPQRAASPRPPAPPFTLTAAQQTELDRLLIAWEKNGAKVNTFESKFTRWDYDAVFGGNDPNKPRFTDHGEVKYAAPDKGVFEVFGERPEHWICDGKSIFQYDFEKTQLIEYKLPPELHGKAITEGPLPFLFGAQADELKRRYFMRIITPAEKARTEVWLEARPRLAQDAENFARAELILDLKTMQPVAIQTHQLNGKSRTAYQFAAPKVNVKDPLERLDPLNVFKKDPFRPYLPRGWTKVVEEPQVTQAGRQPAESARR